MAQTLAETDQMTAALNRATFIERACTVLSEEPTAAHALMILDVDNLKQINDSLGHQAGDRVLTTLVAELRKALRDQDLIGRIGGDEFMILLRNVSDEAARTRAADICRRLLRQLLGGISMSVSLGVSLYPKDGAHFEELYKNADMALYKVKNGGRNGYALSGE